MMLLLLGISLLMNSCASHNYAPVRSYYRDIPKTQKYYVVRKGDTLYAVGFRSGYGHHLIAKWNKLSPPFRLFIGQRLRLFKSRHRSLSSKGHSSAGKKVDKTRIKSQIHPNNHQKTRIKSQKKPSFSYDNKKLLKFNWQWPINGNILRVFSQTGNKGIDISGKLGQAVKAAAAGKVVYSGHGLVGYGNLLIIKHNYHYLSAYANNRRLLVKEGQKVRKGQVIAEVGKMNSSPALLHFEIRKKGKPVNPVKYLPKK